MDPYNYGNYGNLFYDPLSTYGGQYQPGAWAQTPVGGGFGGYLEQPSNWDAAFTRYLGDRGVGQGLSTRDVAANRLFGRYQQGYKAALATNPLLSFHNYLSGAPDINQTLDAMTPGQRGEQPGLFAGRARTIPRG